jgi:hypothetical protein
MPNPDPAHPDPPGEDLDAMVAELRACAASWEPEVRLFGNVPAGEIVRICDALAAGRGDRTAAATPCPRCGLPREPDGAPGCPVGEREAEIRERAEQATPGPWYHEDIRSGWSLNYRGSKPDGEQDGWLADFGIAHGEKDSAFVAHAREDVPWLLTRLDEERAARQAAEAREARLREALRQAISLAEVEEAAGGGGCLLLEEWRTALGEEARPDDGL